VRAGALRLECQRLERQDLNHIAHPAARLGHRQQPREQLDRFLRLPLGEAHPYQGRVRKRIFDQRA
jgi:hypothetical protein